MRICSQKKTIALRKLSNLPIGVFDSGLGGLTVVRQLRRLLPNEKILYLGDLAHLPYGTKSTNEIQTRSGECARFLMRRGIKALVIACNSASSVAYPGLAKSLPVPVFDVITPAVEEAITSTQNFRIGVIATYATIESGSYARALKNCSSDAEYFFKPCPLFVSLAEEGWLNDSIALETARKYLTPIKKKRVDTLILGCTHYPLLGKVIRKVMGKKVRLVDSAVPMALKIKRFLTEKDFLNRIARRGKLKIYVTDFVRNFSRIGEAFLGEHLEIVKVVEVP